LLVKEPTKSDPGIMVRTDNHVPPQQLGKCPETFAPVAVAPEAPEDLNRNRAVCRVVTSAGEVIADDNYDSD
jgi:hypothetical protein